MLTLPTRPALHVLALLVAASVAGCKPRGDGTGPGGSASASTSASSTSSAAQAASASAVVLKPPFEYVLEFNANVQVQQVRGDAIWMTAAPPVEDRLASCSWEPGARLRCKRVAARLPAKAPFPTTAIGAGEPYLDAQQGMFDLRGDLQAKPVDRLATRHGDGVLSLRERKSALLRFAERGAAAKPERISLPPGLLSLDLVGEVVLTTRSEGGITVLEGRRLPSKGPMEAEKRLGTLRFVPDSTLTSGCVSEQSTIAWLLAAQAGKLKVAAVFHGDGGFKEPVEIEVADSSDLKQSAAAGRGLACGEEKLTWVFASGSKIRRVRCQPSGCAETSGPLPGAIARAPVSFVAPLGDRVLVLEVGTDTSVPAKPKVINLRSGPLETLGSAPPRLVLRVEGALVLGTPILIPSGRRVLVLVPTTNPIGTVAFEVGPEGDVTVFAPVL